MNMLLTSFVVVCLVLHSKIIVSALEAEGEGLAYRSKHASSLVNFDMGFIDENASGTYTLQLADIGSGPGMDVVSMAYSGVTAGEIPGEIYLYENQGLERIVDPLTGREHTRPTFKKILVAKRKYALFGQFLDVDQDGFVDIVFLSNFTVPVTSSALNGLVSWARNPGQEVLDATPSVHTGQQQKEWDQFEIGHVPGDHRLISGDFGSGNDNTLIAVPLASEGELPFMGATDLYVFWAEGDPMYTASWQKQCLNVSFYNIHDAHAVPKRDPLQGYDVVLACREGLIRLEITYDELYPGEGFKAQVNTLHGEPADETDAQSFRDVGFQSLTGTTKDGEVTAAGITSLSATDLFDIDSLRFVAAIDYTNSSTYLDGQPWHGDSVSIYSAVAQQTVFDQGVVRHVLEKRGAGGHDVALGNFTTSGCLDVLAGFREYPTGIILYQCELNASAPGGVQFFKQIISERGGNSIVPFDFNGDGVLDFATCGFGMSGDEYINIWMGQGTTESPVKSGSNDVSVVTTILCSVAAAILGVAVTSWMMKNKQVETSRLSSSSLQSNSFHAFTDAMTEA